MNGYHAGTRCARRELPVQCGPCARGAPWSGSLQPATLANDALESNPLVLTAVALPVAGRSEDLLAEQSVLLGLERAVVDGLGLLDFTV